MILKYRTTTVALIALFGIIMYLTIMSVMVYQIGYQSGVCDGREKLSEEVLDDIRRD